MLTLELAGGVTVYMATCTLAVDVTMPGAMMVTEAAAVLLGSVLLAAVTVAVALVVTFPALCFGNRGSQILDFWMVFANENHKGHF